MATPVGEEKVVYLLDPIGASRRSSTLRVWAICSSARSSWLLPFEHEALKLPWTPPFLHKHGGLVLSMGQFMQWVGAQVQSTGTVQIWPGTPVSQALIEEHKVVGVRLLDQGVDKKGQPGDGFMPGMDIHAALTVVGDGPVGPIGQQLDAHFGMPEGSPRPRLGRGHEVRGGFARRHHAQARHRPAHVRLSRSPRSSASSTCIPTASRRSAFSCRRGSTARCAPPTAISSIGCCIRISGAISRAANSARGARRRSANPAGAANRISPATVTRASAKAAARTNVLTGSGVDEAWATGAQLAESRARIAQGEETVHETKPRSDLREAPPRELGGSGKPRGREIPRRIPERHRARHDRHGAGRHDQRPASPLAASRCLRGNAFRRIEKYYRGRVTPGGNRGAP